MELRGNHPTAAVMAMGNIQPSQAQSKQSLKIFVGGLDENVNELELFTYFSKFGRVVDKQIKIDPNTQRSRGFGFVTFKQMESVIAVFSNQPHYLRGAKIDCKPAKSKEESQHELQELRATNRKIFVSNIPKHSSQSEVFNLFSQFGGVEDVNLMYKKKETGFCYITFMDEKFALRALEHPSIFLRNNLLKVVVAIPKEVVPAGVKIPLSHNELSPQPKIDSRQKTRGSLNEISLSPQREHNSKQHVFEVKPRQVPQSVESHNNYLQANPSMRYYDEPSTKFYENVPQSPQMYVGMAQNLYPAQYGDHGSNQFSLVNDPQTEGHYRFTQQHVPLAESRKMGIPEQEETKGLPMPRNMRLLSSHVMGLSASKADEDGLGNHSLASAARCRYSFDIDHTSQQHLLVPVAVPSSRYKLSTLRRLHDCAIPEQVEVGDMSVCPSESDVENPRRTLLSSKPSSPGQPSRQTEQQMVSDFNFIENDFKFKVESTRPTKKPAAALIQEIQHLRHQIRLLEEEKLNLEAELVFDDSRP